MAVTAFIVGVMALVATGYMAGDTYKTDKTDLSMWMLTGFMFVMASLMFGYSYTISTYP